MAKVTIDNLESAVMNILEEYTDEVQKNVDEITKRVGKVGVQALRSESRAKFGGDGKYARGWNTEVEVTRYGTTVTIYNNLAGLPHLLEFGHAMRNGGRVDGRSHIKPVEEKLIQLMEMEVRTKL